MAYNYPGRICQTSGVDRSPTTNPVACIRARDAAGGRDGFGRWQERAGRRAVPVAGPAGREGGAVQGAEHVAELVRDPGRRRDRPGPGHAGGRGRHRAGRRHEPGAAQAGQRPAQPGRRARPPRGRSRRGRVPRARAAAAAGRPGQPGPAAGRLRRGHLRGRGQPGRDQPARNRRGQHGPGPRGRPAGHRDRRHRPRRRVRRDVRHAGPALTRRPGAHLRLRHQQVPRRPGTAGQRPDHAPPAHRPPGLRRPALAGRPLARRRRLALLALLHPRLLDHCRP